VVPDSTDPAALAAAGLARSIAARSVAPLVASWDGVVPSSAGADFAAAGLLDPSLPRAAAAEAAREAGRASCAFGLAVFGPAPLLVAAVLGGAGEALVDVGTAYARDRVVFGRPLATMPVQRYAFASCAAAVEAAVALVRRVAAALDTASPVSSLDQAALVPYALDAAWAAAEAALQVHGGYGYSDEQPVSRMWREVVAARAAYARQ
jgi:alkylation response protein AidB-like acyl-CoA dehydrogenase